MTSHLSKDGLVGKGVGVVGLGRMGTPVAVTLRRAGIEVVATSRSSKRRDDLTAAGVTLVATPAQVASLATTILVSVFDTDALRNVIEGPAGLLEELKEGTIVIDLGTSGIEATRELATKVERAGGRYIDAPVSGGTRGAQSGQLTIMAGGSAQTIDAAQTVLAVLGRLNHMGPVGAGQSTKAVNQLVLGQTLVAVAEGLALSCRLGLDPARVREALLGGFAESRVLIEHGRRMVEGDFTPGGSIAVFDKDLRLVSDLADEIGIDLNGLDNARRQYDASMKAGMSHLDQSAVYKLYKK